MAKSAKKKPEGSIYLAVPNKKGDSMIALAGSIGLWPNNSKHAAMIKKAKKHLKKTGEPLEITGCNIRVYAGQVEFDDEF